MTKISEIDKTNSNRSKYINHEMYTPMAQTAKLTASCAEARQKSIKMIFGM